MPSQNNKARIGLLATGNELTEGDILNTNGQIIARQLTDQGLSVGMHIIASDDEQDITNGLQFLLNNHTIVIITGGLGPTSDDRTRYALSTVINKPLIFSETTWEHIVERYKKLGLQTPHPSNQQQALFPTDAIIIPNHNGSAAGCQVTYNNKIIYMLPGPPSECLPMFKEAVLPILKTQQNNAIKKLKWRLLGVIESDIAAKVDEVVKDHNVITGYRIDYPYLEVKIYAEELALINAIETKINVLFQQYVVVSTEKTISDLLKEAIIKCKYPIMIEDHATHGQLQAQLTNPFTYQKLIFAKVEQTNHQVINILITGLNAFWTNQAPTGRDTINLQLSFQDKEKVVNLSVPFRNNLVVKYAMEYIAQAILKFLETIN